ncbi:MAG: ABC transporter substrate-binding protein [Oligoflexia bacterium]|nr:ABC transporter substrate-binding protein [Oligoflexia bacterium]
MKPLCCLYLLMLAITPIPARALPPQWKVGVLAPLTGDVAAWGQDTRRALELANEMLGRGEFRIVFEDDRCQGKAAVSAAQRLLSVERIDFGMIVCTEPTLSTAPIFERHKVAVVAPGATGASVSNAGDYIFRTWPSDQKMVEALFAYAKKRYSHPAVVTESRGMPEEFTRTLLRLSSAAKMPFESEEFLTGETDLASLLLRLKAHQPDALFISTDSDRTLSNIVQQLHMLNWKLPLLGQFIAGSPQFYEKAGALAEGLVFGDSPEVVCGDGKPGCEVLAEYLSRYGHPESSIFMVSSTIAAFMVIADAARSGETPKDHLYKARVETLLGSISFDQNGDVVGPAPALKVIKDGRPVPLN